jgi:hypothetical protein
MSVTAVNVLVGIGDFKVDGTSMGSTRGGVTITKETEVFEKMVDQELSPLGMNKIRETYRVSTEIAETDLDNLKTLWDIPNSVETSSPTRTLSWGTTSTISYLTLEFYGKSPEGLDRKFYCYRAFISEVGDSVLAKDDITVVPVTFTLYADTDKPTGKQIGYIEDTIA